MLFLQLKRMVVNVAL